MRAKEEKFFIAVENNEIDLVKKILTRLFFFNRINVNVRNFFGSTPLHIAAINNLPEMVKLLLKHGAAPDAADGDGKTPLHFSAGNGNVANIRNLVQHGASLNPRDTDGRVPLGCAISGDHIDAVKCLIKLGADINALDPDGKYPGATLLHKAVCQGFSQAVALLLAAGADVYTQDSIGQSPLDYAQKSSREILDLFKIHMAGLSGENVVKSSPR